MNKFPFEEIERDILVKRKAEAEVQATPLPLKDLVSYGIVNIDKPPGPTSHQTAEFVKKILGLKKAGHSGTLDPQVTGVLAVAIGKATRITQALLPAGKEYVAVMYLHKEVDEKDIRAAFKALTGKIMQMPPVKSAVRRIERPRSVYYIDIMEIDKQHVLFKIGCEAGTYIRKYIHDLGKKLGCGAHMVELRRTKVATFDESTCYTLQDLADAFHYYKENNEKFLKEIIQPIETGVKHLPKVWVLNSTKKPLTHGRDLAIPGIVKLESEIKKDDLVAILDQNNLLISLGTAIMTSEEIMKQEKGIAVKNEKVFIH